ncbi:MAG: hypothetical protein AB1540_02255, partial [Bdellovibrionota bacterium]
SYFLRILNREKLTHVQITARFDRTLKRKTLPEKVFQIDLDKLKNAADQMSEAGFTDVGARLSKLVQRAQVTGKKISIFDVKTAFASSARYSKVAEKETSALTTDVKNRFSKYSKFAVDGRLCGQCDSANSMFNDLAQILFEGDDRISFSTVGVVRSRARLPLGRQRIYLHDIGHLMTQLNIDGQPAAILDATPWRPDPRNPFNPKEWAKNALRAARAWFRDRAFKPEKQDIEKSAVTEAQEKEELAEKQKISKLDEIEVKQAEQQKNNAGFIETLPVDEPKESPWITRYSSQSQKKQADFLKDFAKYRSRLRSTNSDPAKSVYALLKVNSDFLANNSTLEAAKLQLIRLFPGKDAESIHSPETLLSFTASRARDVAKELRYIENLSPKHAHNKFPHLAKIEDQRKLRELASHVELPALALKNPEIESHRAYLAKIERKLGAAAGKSATGTGCATQAVGNLVRNAVLKGR